LIADGLGGTASVFQGVGQDRMKLHNQFTAETLCDRPRLARSLNLS
jgi:hypothetical protein